MLFRSGATVLFEATQNDAGYWNVKGKVEVKDGAPASPAASQSAPKGSQDTQYSIMYQTALKASAGVTAALANAGRYKSLTDQELDQEVIERTKRYFDSVKNLGSSAAPVAKPLPAVPQCACAPPLKQRLLTPFPFAWQVQFLYAEVHLHLL